MTLKIDEEKVAVATLSSVLNKVLDYIEEPCNRLDFDDYERGEAAMAAAVFWIISDNLNTEEVYSAK